MNAQEIRDLRAQLKTELMIAEMAVDSVKGKIRALQRNCDHEHRQQWHTKDELTIVCKDCGDYIQ